MSRSSALLLVVLAGLLARVGAVAVLGIDGPWQGDERGYVLVARSLVAGDGFALPLPPELAELHPQRSPLTAFRTPGLPLLLVPLVAFGASDAALRLLTAVVGVTLGPLLLLALRGTRWERVAVWPALALAVWPPLVHLSVHVLTEVWAIALLLGSVHLLGSPDDRRRAGVAGLLAGLAVLLRPAVLPAAGLLLLCAGWRGASRTRSRPWRSVATGLLGLLVVVLPWVVRNAALHGRPLLSTNSGVTLVGANSAAAAGATWPGKWLPPDEVYADSATPPDLGMWGWSDLTEEQSDARFAQDARGWIGAHPGEWLRLTGWKVVRLFDPDPRSSKPDARRKAWIGWLTLPPVLLAALLGLLRARRGGRELRPWLALLAGTLVTTCVFYGDTRMRTPADPALLVLATHGLAIAWDRRSALEDADLTRRPT